MTLIIGARCTDGVVLAADRRELRSYAPTETTKVRKIELGSGKKKIASVMLAGAGVAAFWHEVAWQLPIAIKAGNGQGVDSLLDVVSRVSFLSINMSGRYQREGLDDRLGCVIAGLDKLTSGKAEMYYFAGAGFSSADFVCLGSGEANALPMADLLLRQKSLTVKQAAQVMPFLFLLVERVNVSVAGGPDVFVLKDGKRPEQVSAKRVVIARKGAVAAMGTLPGRLAFLAQDTPSL